MQNILRSVLRGASFAVATGIVAAGAVALPASAAPSINHVTLDIRQSVECGDGLLVEIGALATMSQATAQLFIDTPGDDAELSLWGDDSSDDDLLGDRVVPTWYVADSNGLWFGWRGCVSYDILNEDPSYWGDIFDEIYAKVTVWDFRDGSHFSGKSPNVVTAIV